MSGNVKSIKFFEYPGISDLVMRQRIGEMTSIYVGGSLRNPLIPMFANRIEELGLEAFADWKQPGPEADDHWREYARMRGWNYRQALDSYGASQIFDFDKLHLDRTDGMVLLMPAGKSAHLELGYTVGRGKPGFIVFEEEPERWDVMVKFATKIFFSQDEFINYLKEIRNADHR